MRRLVLVLIAICTITVIGFGFAVKVDAAQAEFTLTQPELSSILPTKVTTTKDGNKCNGSNLSECVQFFAWQSFLALNWPANKDGEPLEIEIGKKPCAPRVWEFYPRPDEVFRPQGQQRALSLTEKQKIPVRAMFSKGQTLSENQLESPNPILDPTQQPLVDQTHNYVLYDIRINPSEAEQIVKNHWNNTNCLEKLTNGINLLDKSLEIKTAWRIVSYVKPTGKKISVTDDSGKSVYYTVTQKVDIPDKNVYPSSSPGKNSVDLELGLIGFHIAYKVPIEGSSNGNPQWVWATFEHIDNTPDDPNKPEANKTYTLYNPSIPCNGNAGSDGSNCNTLQAKTPYYFNTTEPPSAVTEQGNVQTPTQVVRKGNLAMTNSTAMENPWPKKLQGTVWDNYQMRGAGVQWEKSLNTPPLLANSAIETYVKKNNQSCFACHKLAKLPPKFNLSADFSYLFPFNAKDLGTCPVESSLQAERY